jgi:hypothetical protein
MSNIPCLISGHFLRKFVVLFLVFWLPKWVGLVRSVSHRCIASGLLQLINVYTDSLTESGAFGGADTAFFRATFCLTISDTWFKKSESVQNVLHSLKCFKPVRSLNRKVLDEE